MRTPAVPGPLPQWQPDRKSTRLNSSHLVISYAVFCLKKKTQQTQPTTIANRFNIHIPRSKISTLTTKLFLTPPVPSHITTLFKLLPSDYIYVHNLIST